SISPTPRSRSISASSAWPRQPACCWCSGPGWRCCSGLRTSGGSVPAAGSLFTEADHMRRHFGLFFDYLTQYIKVRLSYRGDFFISIFTSFAATISSFLFLVVLFTKIPNLQGWNFYEMMFLYSFGLIPYGLFNIISLNLSHFGTNTITHS